MTGWGAFGSVPVPNGVPVLSVVPAAGCGADERPWPGRGRVPVTAPVTVLVTEGTDPVIALVVGWTAGGSAPVTTGRTLFMV